MTTLPAVTLPGLTPALRAQVERLTGAPISRWPGVTSDDPGLQLATEGAAGPEHDPSARLVARALRAATARCADVATVRLWLKPLAALVGNTPNSRDFDAFVPGLADICRDLPACVWTVETQREAARTFDFWPSASKVYRLLKPHADRLRAEIDALERIARAKPWTPAREAKGYVPPAAPPATDPHASMPSSFRLNPRPPERTVEQMIAELGVTPTMLQRAKAKQAERGKGSDRGRLRKAGGDPGR